MQSLTKEKLLKGWKQSKYIIIKNRELTAAAFGGAILEILKTEDEITLCKSPDTIELHLRTTFKSLTRRKD